MGLERGKLDADKLNRLKQGGVYAICCYVSDCPCEAKDTPCTRGFFSLFIQAVYGIELAKRYDIPCYVDFGNHPYLYTDPAKPEQNFWNYYFEQPEVQSLKLKEVNLIRNSFNEVYPLRIWNRQHFRELNHIVVGKLVFHERVEKLLQEKRVFYQSHKILGVQIRRTDHYKEIEQVNLSTYLSTIDRKIKKYDYLFVATDDNNVLELLRKRYKSKLICNEVTRSDDDVAVHSNLKIHDRYKLGEEALLDCYCLSLCTHSILMQSNISYAALLFNPDLAYTLIEKGNFILKIKRLIYARLPKLTK